MNDISVNALVIGSYYYGESDRIVTLFSAENGIFDAKARGVRKMTSKNASSLDLFVYAFVELAEKGGRYTVKTAARQNSFKDLYVEPERFALACYFAEVCKRLCGVQSPEPEVLRLLLNALYLLENPSDKPLSLIKAAFEFKICALLGFMPALDVCASCGRGLLTDKGAVFSFAASGVFDEACAKDASGTLFSLSAGVLAALRFVASAPVNRFCAFRIGEGDMATFGVFCEKYLLSVAETGFPTLKYYHSLTKL